MNITDGPSAALEAGAAMKGQLEHVRHELTKRLLKEHSISEDDERRALDAVQKVTDEHIAGIDELQKAKDSELLER